MAKETLVMDPVHGFINISEYPIIKEIIETKYFQRLRRLSQLGLTSAVYPNATHTRFAHCLGVMHVFLILFDSITRRDTNEINEKGKKRMTGAVTALLHDLGHGPFSHASESILDKKFGNFNHLDMTCDIIQQTEIADILNSYNIEPRLVCDILHNEVEREWLLVSQLVSSQLDADRLDYLVRDSYFTGVNYGQIEIQRIANTLQIWHGNSNDPFADTVIVDTKGISAIEDYVLGRYLMYRGVYFHKISRCMELLLMNVFKRASKLPDTETNLSRVIDIDQKTTPELLYKMDDSTCMALFHKWIKTKDPILQDLSKRILERGKLPSIQISRKKYMKLGIEKLSKLPMTLDGTNFSKDYYFIEDNVEKSAYDVYTPAELDDVGFSPIEHIMTPDENNQLQEITSQSKIIQTLSDNEVKVVNIFVPEEVLPKVKHIVDNSNK